MIRIEVSEGKLPWIIGIGTILFGALLTVLSLMYPDNSKGVTMFAYPVIVLIIGSGIWFCLDGKNRRLTVEDNLLCYTNWLGSKKTFSLDEISYCYAAFETKHGNNNYMKLYDAHDKILCKLELDMINSFLFLEYLLDNDIKVESTERSDSYLNWILNISNITAQEVPLTVNAAYKEAKALIEEWTKKNNRFEAEWKIGLVAYMENEIEEDKQLWQQKGYSKEIHTKGEMPWDKEGYFMIIEGYLQKGGEFVFDKKNNPVMISTKLLHVSKSMRIGEALKICFYGKALEYLSEQLLYYEDILPKKRYHTEAFTLNHMLIDDIDLT